MAHIVLVSPDKPFCWDQAKNLRLQAERHISFEEVVLAIQHEGLLDVFRHPNAARYPRQWLMIVSVRNYAHAVPFVEDEDCRFLKTIVPSRKATRRYLGHDRQDKDAPGSDG